MAATGSQDCRCGQSTKVIMLVGCTGHGKSRLIRAILDYAGMDGGVVKVSAFGNSSTTKDCKTFEAVVKIKDHFLRGYEGEIYTPSLDDYTAAKVTELRDVADEEYSTDTGKHIHLKIIDTPGFDDSDNAAEDRKKQVDETQENMPMRTVDQKHKVAIVKALARLTSINSVCFVVNVMKNMGPSLKDFLNEYLDTFRMSNLSWSYFFIHTHASVDQLFDSELRSRPATLERIFDVRGATHHFMDNEANEQDPVALYFANCAMARLLSGLADQPPWSVSDLKLPKADDHRLMEASLKMGIEVDERYYQEQFDKLKQELSELEAKKRRLEGRRRAEQESLSALERRCADLDTTELVVIGEKHTGFERSHLLSWSRIHFSISTDVPIRHISRWPGNSPVNSTWSSEYDKQHLDTKYYTNTLESKNWNTEIEASITLSGYKRDVMADDLARATREKDEAHADYQQTVDQIAEADKEIAKTTSSRASHAEDMENCRNLKASLKTPTFTASTIQTSGEYIATCSLLSYGQALGLTTNRIWLFQFPEAPPVSSMEQAAREYGGKVETFAKILEHCTAMADVVEDYLEAVGVILEQLIGRKDMLLTALTELTQKANAMGEWSPIADPWVSAAGDPEAAERVLDALRSEFLPRLEFGRDTSRRALQEYGEALDARRQIVEETAKGLERLRDSHRETLKKWVDKKEGAEASLAAARLLKAFLVQIKDERNVSLAVFAVMKAAIDRFGANSGKVWDSLFFHLREMYRDKPSGWDPKRSL